MPLGIKPTVDFAFKKIFGSPHNSKALIGLLNAILGLQSPITEVQLLNPFSYQEFAESKLIVLDVRCRDGVGRWLNVEMQVSAYNGLLQRLVYYACRMYGDQLGISQNYAKATHAISICLLDKCLFRDTEKAHHRFQMVDMESRRELDNAIEVHTVELPKYNLSEATITHAEKLHQWVFLMLHSHEYDAERLQEILPGVEFAQAIGTLAIISTKTEDRQMYDQREKAQRDYEWAMSGAREEGLEIGLERGKLAGKIQILQELLGEPIDADADLRLLSYDDLDQRLAGLQQRLRDRSA